MSEVARRLADGAAAVADWSAYLAACAAAGHRRPGLTPSAITQWYLTEEGLRLSALDADIAALTAAAAAGADALALQRAALQILSGGWVGESGSAACEFVARQCAAAATVVDGLRQAAETLARLRAALAARVDEKVDATVRIGDRADGPAWRELADAVLHGAASPATLAEVRARIGPYVDADIGSEWLAAMRAGTDGVDTAYRDATARLAEVGSPVFAIAAPPAVTAAAPHRGQPPPAPAAPPMLPVAGPAAGMPAGPTFGAAPAAAAPNSPVAAVPDSPFPAAAPPAPAGPGAPPQTAPVTARRRRLAEDDDGPPAEDDTDETPAEKPAEKPAEPVTEPGVATQEDTVTEPAPVISPAPLPPPPPPLPGPEPLPPPLAAEAPEPGRTPCEIAADELPQVGQ